MATGTGLAPFKGFRSLLAQEPALTLQQRFNRLFEEAFRPLALPGEEPTFLAAWTPSCDIYQTDKEIVVKAEIPGVKKEDVKLSIQDNMLTLSGERKFEEETKKENYVRIERGYGSFTRSFTLPPSVDAKKISAEFKDGVLEVKLPKLEPPSPKKWRSRSNKVVIVDRDLYAGTSHNAVDGL
jgi:HSP20 family protein